MKPRPCALEYGALPSLPEVDREIVARLAGAFDSFAPSYQPGQRLSCDYDVPDPLLADLLPRLARTGRCLLRPDGPGRPEPLLWDDGPPWQFRLEARRETEPADHPGYGIEGFFLRGEDRVDLSEVRLVVGDRLLLVVGTVALMEIDGSPLWLTLLRRDGPIRFKGRDALSGVGKLLSLRRLPPLDLPDELRYKDVRISPVPCLRVRAGAERLRAELVFDYGGRMIGWREPGAAVDDVVRRRRIVRDEATEAAAAREIERRGLTRRRREREWLLEPDRLPSLVRELVGAGWRVEAHGKLYRRPGNWQFSVASGIDWFDLTATLDFGGVAASLPELLAALRNNENIVLLGDGTYGMLPEEWLRRYARVVLAGRPEGRVLRFDRSQIPLLDALVAEQPGSVWDEAFAVARQELRRFEGIAPAEPGSSFCGTLRGYQKHGLGWLHFLQSFGFGGVLADEMGLGKTVQVLALLASRREHAEAPSLVVMPRSVLFNWRAEAARFAPALRVLDHAGADRRA